MDCRLFLASIVCLAVIACDSDSDSLSEREIEFINKVRKPNIDLLCHPEGAYLECLSVEEQRCRDLLDVNVLECVEATEMQVPIPAGDTVDMEKTAEFGKRYMQCHVDFQLEQLGITRANFDKCLSSEE